MRVARNYRVIILDSFLLLATTTFSQGATVGLRASFNLHPYAESVFFTHTQGALAGPANPYPFEAIQPDSTTVTIRLFGDETYHYAETIDGYTVIRDSSGTAWVYAFRDAEGKLSSTAILARDPEARSVQDAQVLRSIGPHVRPSEQVIEELLNQRPPRAGPSGSTPPLMERLFRKTGGHSVTMKILVLLVDFQDLSGESSIQAKREMLIQPDWNGGIGAHGSFNDYLREVSYGQVGIDADVYGWFTSTNDQLYYGDRHGASRTRELVAEAIDAANANGVDFSEYDNDGDGNCDGVIIIHAGRGAAQREDTRFIWPHQWNLGDNKRNYDGVEISRYSVQAEKQYDRQAGVGMLAHEFMHLMFELPDLYDLDDSSSGIGIWGLMGSGNWLDRGKTPAHLSAWSKKQLQWVSPQLIETDGSYTFTPAEVDPDKVYRINLANSSSEYFLVENRQRLGFDSHLPGTGLLIWHVDDAKSSNRNELHKWVDLEEADGNDDLDRDVNRGDAGDPFPGIHGNRRFYYQSNPSSRSYYETVPSNVAIWNISNSSDVMTAMVSITTPVAAYTSNVQTGHAPLSVSFMDQSVSPKAITHWSWDLDGDGIVDSNDQNPTWLYTQPGQYTVVLEVSNSSVAPTAPLTKENFIHVFNGESALLFQNQGELARIPKHASLDVSDAMTFEAWINPLGWGRRTGGLARIADKANSFWIYLRETGDDEQNNANSVVFALQDENNKKSRWNTPTGSISLGKWQHLAVTYNVENATGEKVEMYIDGIRQSIDGIGELTGVIGHQVSNDFFIGNASIKIYSFQGRIDEVRLWDIARTETEVVDGMARNLLGTETGLVGYWKMNEGNGEVVKDLSANANDGVVASRWGEGVELASSVTIADEIEAPRTFTLFENYPNPFNSETRIRFTLPEEAHVSVRVFNVLGQLISTLLNEELIAGGDHQIRFLDEQLSSGVYFCTISARSTDGTTFNGSMPMILMK